LYCGVTCHNISHADFVILRGLLASEELNNSSEWWVGWGYLPIFPFTVDFIFEMHNNRKEFITNSAQSFWQKFLILRPEVEKINHQLLETNEVIEN